MRKTLAVIALLAMLSPVFAKDEGIRLSIYNRGIVQISLVKEVKLNRGENRITFNDLAEKIIPETVILKPMNSEDKISIIQGDYLYDLVELEKIWMRYIGETVNLTIDEEPVSGLLLNFDDDYLYLQPDTGGLRIIERSSLDQLSFPGLKDGLVSKPELHFMVDNQGSAGRYDFELNYLSSGMMWSVYYNALYKDGKLELSGDFLIDNYLPQGFDGAELSLIAGDPHMSYDKEELPRSADLLEGSTAGMDGEPLFAYYIYPVKMKVDLPRNGLKSIPFLGSKRFFAEEKYIMKEGFGLRNLETVLCFNASDVPFPEGEISIYRQDEEGRSHLMGEDHLYNTPPGGKVEIKVGRAFNLQGDRKRVSHQRLNRNATEDKIRVKLMNGSDKDEEVIVRERLFGVWTIESAEFNGKSVEYTEIDSRRVEFKVKLKKHSNSALEYKVRYEY